MKKILLISILFVEAANAQIGRFYVYNKSNIAIDYAPIASLSNSCSTVGFPDVFVRIPPNTTHTFVAFSFPTNLPSVSSERLWAFFSNAKQTKLTASIANRTYGQSTSKIKLMFRGMSFKSPAYPTISGVVSDYSSQLVCVGGNEAPTSYKAFTTPKSLKVTYSYSGSNRVVVITN